MSERQSQNPRYSLRAFARDLGLSPQQLSNIMNGKRGMSREKAEALSKKLGFSLKEQDHFIAIVESEFARSPIAKRIATAKLKSKNQIKPKVIQLQDDTFRTISDWYHFGIIEWIKRSPPHEQTESVISSRLGIPVLEVRRAIQRLVRLKLIQFQKNHYKAKQDTVLTTDGVPSEALRKFHRQLLEKATIALSHQSVDERVFSSSILPIRVSDLPKAAQLIREFREKFSELICNEPEGQEIYSLGIHFFRLSEKSTSINKENK